MEYYDVNIAWGRAILEITLQCWNYKGKYRLETGGNVKGIDLMERAFETDWLENKDVIWNNCKLNINENDYYNCELEDIEGNILEIDGTTQELADLIVKVEIIKFEEEEC